MKKTNIKSNFAFNIVGIFVVLLILTAVFAPYIAPNDPNTTNIMMAQAPPSKQYPLGTDPLGRCMLSRVIYGARISIFTSLTVTFVVFTAGVLVGVISGYFGGVIDIVFNKLITIMQTFPKIILVIAIAGTLGIGIQNTMIALCMVEWVEYARLARRFSFAEKQHTYVKAARVCGESHMKIIFKRIIPNIIYPLIVNAGLGIASIIMEIAALSYLGIGVKDSVPEWGAMVNLGRNYIQTNAKLILIPGIAVFVTAAVFNLLGEKLRDRLK